MSKQSKRVWKKVKSMNQQQTLFANLICMFLRMFSYELSIQFSKCVQFSRHTRCAAVNYLEAYRNHHTIRQFLSILFRHPSTFLSSSTVRVRDAYWLRNADNDFRQVNKHLTSFHFIALFLSPLINAGVQIHFNLL